MLLALPEGQQFLAGAVQVLEIYESGEQRQAFAAFMSAVSGLEWDSCRETLEASAPGVVGQSVKDADTFFEIELP